MSSKHFLDKKRSTTSKTGTTATASSDTQDAFWKSIINKYEDRNAELESELIHLRERVDQMRCAVPAVMTFDMAKLAKDRPNANISKLTTPCTFCPKASAKATASEPLKLPNMNNANVFSIEPADLCYMEKIKELTQREKCLIEEVNKLRGKDKAMRTAKEKVEKLAKSVDKNGPTLSYGGKDVPEISDSFLRENQRLYDEISDLKLELKHMQENIQGPMTRELERERRKNASLECQLKMKNAEVVCKCQDTDAEMQLMKSKLETTSKNLSELQDINIKLKDEIVFLTRRMEQLQTDLINQKLSEATTLATLKAQLDRRCTNIDSGGYYPRGPPPPPPSHPPDSSSRSPTCNPSDKGQMKPEKDKSQPSQTPIGFSSQGLVGKLTGEAATPASQKLLPESILETVADIKDLCDFIDEQCADQTTSVKSNNIICTDVICTKKIKSADVKPLSDHVISCAPQQDVFPRKKPSVCSCTASENDSEDADIMVFESQKEDVVTTTVVRLGVLEVVTEGAEGVIETTLVVTDDGNIDVVTEITGIVENESERERLNDFEEPCGAPCSEQKEIVCPDECAPMKWISDEDVSPHGVGEEYEEVLITSHEIEKESVISGLLKKSPESAEYVEENLPSTKTSEVKKDDETGIQLEYIKQEVSSEKSVVTAIKLEDIKQEVSSEKSVEQAPDELPHIESKEKSMSQEKTSQQEETSIPAIKSEEAESPINASENIIEGSESIKETVVSEKSSGLKSPNKFSISNQSAVSKQKVELEEEFEVAGRNFAGGVAEEEYFAPVDAKESKEKSRDSSKLSELIEADVPAIESEDIYQVSLENSVEQTPDELPNIESKEESLIRENSSQQEESNISSIKSKETDSPKKSSDQEDEPTMETVVSEKSSSQMEIGEPVGESTIIEKSSMSAKESEVSKQTAEFEEEFGAKSSCISGRIPENESFASVETSKNEEEINSSIKITDEFSSGPSAEIVESKEPSTNSSEVNKAIKPGDINQEVSSGELVRQSSDEFPNIESKDKSMIREKSSQLEETNIPVTKSKEVESLETSSEGLTQESGVLVELSAVIEKPSMSVKASPVPKQTIEFEEEAAKISSISGTVSEKESFYSDEAKVSIQSSTNKEEIIRSVKDSYEFSSGSLVKDDFRDISYDESIIYTSANASLVKEVVQDISYEESIIYTSAKASLVKEVVQDISYEESIIYTSAKASPVKNISGSEVSEAGFAAAISREKLSSDENGSIDSAAKQFSSELDVNISKVEAVDKTSSKSCKVVPDVESFVKSPSRSCKDVPMGISENELIISAHEMISAESQGVDAAEVKEMATEYYNDEEDASAKLTEITEVTSDLNETEKAEIAGEITEQELPAMADTSLEEFDTGQLPLTPEAEIEPEGQGVQIEMSSKESVKTTETLESFTQDALEQKVQDEIEASYTEADAINIEEKIFITVNVDEFNVVAEVRKVIEAAIIIEEDAKDLANELPNLENSAEEDELLDESQDIQEEIEEKGEEQVKTSQIQDKNDQLVGSQSESFVIGKLVDEVVKAVESEGVCQKECNEVDSLLIREATPEDLMTDVKEIGELKKQSANKVVEDIYDIVLEEATSKQAVRDVPDYLEEGIVLEEATSKQAVADALDDLEEGIVLEEETPKQAVQEAPDDVEEGIFLEKATSKQAVQEAPDDLEEGIDLEEATSKQAVQEAPDDLEEEIILEDATSKQAEQEAPDDLEEGIVSEKATSKQAITEAPDDLEEGPAIVDQIEAQANPETVGTEDEREKMRKSDSEEELIEKVESKQEIDNDNIDEEKTSISPEAADEEVRAANKADSVTQEGGDSQIDVPSEKFSQTKDQKSRSSKTDVKSPCDCVYSKIPLPIIITSCTCGLSFHECTCRTLNSTFPWSGPRCLPCDWPEQIQQKSCYRQPIKVKDICCGSFLGNKSSRTTKMDKGVNHPKDKQTQVRDTSNCPDILKLLENAKKELTECRHKSLKRSRTGKESQEKFGEVLRDKRFERGSEIIKKSKMSGKIDKKISSNVISKNNLAGPTKNSLRQDNASDDFKKPTSRGRKVLREFCSSKCYCGRIVNDNEKNTSSDFIKSSSEFKKNDQKNQQPAKKISAKVNELSKGSRISKIDSPVNTSQNNFNKCPCKMVQMSSKIPKKVKDGSMPHASLMLPKAAAVEKEINSLSYQFKKVDKTDPIDKSFVKPTSNSSSNDSSSGKGNSLSPDNVDFKINKKSSYISASAVPLKQPLSNSNQVMSTIPNNNQEECFSCESTCGTIIVKTPTLPKNEMDNICSQMESITCRFNGGMQCLNRNQTEGDHRKISADKSSDNKPIVKISDIYKIEPTDRNQGSELCCDEFCGMQKLNSFEMDFKKLMLELDEAPIYASSPKASPQPKIKAVESSKEKDSSKPYVSPVQTFTCAIDSLTWPCESKYRKQKAESSAKLPIQNPSVESGGNESTSHDAIKYRKTVSSQMICKGSPKLGTLKRNCKTHAVDCNCIDCITIGFDEKSSDSSLSVNDDHTEKKPCTSGSFKKLDYALGSGQYNEIENHRSNDGPGIVSFRKSIVNSALIFETNPFKTLYDEIRKSKNENMNHSPLEESLVEPKHSKQAENGLLESAISVVSNGSRMMKLHSTISSKRASMNMKELMTNSPENQLPLSKKKVDLFKFKKGSKSLEELPPKKLPSLIGLLNKTQNLKKGEESYKHTKAVNLSPKLSISLNNTAYMNSKCIEQIREKNCKLMEKSVKLVSKLSKVLSVTKTEINKNDDDLFLITSPINTLKESKSQKVNQGAPIIEEFQDDHKKEINQLQELTMQLKEVCSKANKNPRSKYVATLALLQSSLSKFQEKCKTGDLIIDALKNGLESSPIKSSDLEKASCRLSNSSQINYGEEGSSQKFCKESIALQIVDFKRLGPSCLMIKWIPTVREGVTGYKIFVNGVKKAQIFSVTRTTAMLDDLKTMTDLEIQLFAFTENGLCAPGAIAYYKFS